MFLLYTTEIPLKWAGFGGFLRDSLLIYGKVITLKNLSTEIAIAITKMIVKAEVTKIHSIKQDVYI